MSQADLQKLQQEFQQKEQLISQRFNLNNNKLLKKVKQRNDTLVKKVKDFVKNYGDKNGYTFILGSNEAGSVMYGKENMTLHKQY